ncbi:MAG: hypothetical protein GWN01_08615, partial [Nitrosopumilaceae archaeon]|nr:hypothetical protein [Nitrosopumilaceae archaeon]NIU87425.1 hypothetical protein [Nitrosopumilaceae archaeon]NIV65947.1 hypothetical protein [Nitrosopumilaceae archaeon]NIX61579.1 hypothetical protein [Nitrosopumilaceae archaeon]
MNQEKENISFTFRLLKTILQNIKFLVIFNFIVAVIAVIFLLIMDKEYKSSILFSVESEAGTAQISTLLQQLPVNFGSHGGATPDRFIRLATSRTVLDSIINAFDLINYYEQEFRETTYDAVKGNLGLIDNGDGTITLSYISPDPQLSADIANKFFE